MQKCARSPRRRCSARAGGGPAAIDGSARSRLRRAGRLRIPMFDIGFSEIVVIAVVALVVIGPERLPKTARTLGHLFGRLQRYVSDVKADISREIELDELRKLQREMQGAARDFEQTVTSAASEVQAGVRS